jgi:hypothetical protein
MFALHRAHSHANFELLPEQCLRPDFESGLFPFSPKRPTQPVLPTLSLPDACHVLSALSDTVEKVESAPIPAVFWQILLYNTYRVR